MFNKIESRAITIAIVAVFVLGSSNILVSASEASNMRVASGGNGSSWDTYSPQNITINAGDSVTWYSPSPVPEPHTVTFLTDPSYFPPLFVPFSIPNSTDIVSTIPDPNVEPIILPPDPSNSERKVVLMDNARAFNPVTIDSTGENVTYLQPNSNYTMSGSEKFVNSGFLFPEGLIPPGVPPLTEFTLTFENDAEYNYVCALHPWMVGSVTVT